MTYNFRDDPSPSMPIQIDATGALSLADGTPQGDLLTDAFSGTSVAVSVVPPRGWSLDSVDWPNGGRGTFSVPGPGVEEIHAFTYTVSQGGQSMSGSAQFKIKKQGDGGG